MSTKVIYSNGPDSLTLEGYSAESVVLILDTFLGAGLAAYEPELIIQVTEFPQSAEETERDAGNTPILTADAIRDFINGDDDRFASRSIGAIAKHFGQHESTVREIVGGTSIFRTRESIRPHIGTLVSVAD